jgi:hypothetical protein
MRTMVSGYLDMVLDSQGQQDAPKGECCKACDGYDDALHW